MNKQLLLSLLLITNTVTHSMKRENPNDKCSILSNNQGAMVLCQSDLIPQITTALCNAHKYKLSKIRKDIAGFSTINKFLHDYFNPTTTKQNIIRLCSVHLNSNDLYVARMLHCTQIANKLDYFTAIALDESKEFTKEDLEQEWYLSAHTNFYNHFLRETIQQSLLLVTINHSRLKKVHDILDNTKELHFQYNTESSILHNIIEKRSYAKESGMLAFPNITDSCPNDELRDNLISIARQLLEKKNILVDGRAENTQMTPLMQAIDKQDKPFTQLLLEFNADPLLKGYNAWKNTQETAFDYEPHAGWLQEIIDKVTTNKNKTQTL